MKKILFIINKDITLFFFRKELVEKLRQIGYEVYISSPKGDKLKYFESLGCVIIDSPIDRKSMNPLKDLILLKHYKKIILKIKPDFVLSYTIKPNIYGGLICKKYKTSFIPNITGLGSTFQKKGLLFILLKYLYKISFKKATAIFFQNKSNMEFFNHNIYNFKNSILVPGSGVNLQTFKYQDLIDDGIVKFLFIARIMREKGIEEYLYSAKLMKQKYKNKVEFYVAGFCEEAYNTILNDLHKDKIINYVGFTDNSYDLIKKCDCIVLPSYHEGMSNVLLEAHSTGRAVIASNIPGCKEIFDDKISGLSVKVKDEKDLFEKVEMFYLLDFTEKKKMGFNGRQKVEKEFNRNIVVEKYLKILEEI